jgi:glycosyltransferase involved in cell wall biosynthesis
MDMRVTLVIPAYNEAESLPHLFAEIDRVCQAEKLDYSILVIDDGSRDETFAMVKAGHESNNRINGVRFRSNRGKAAALAEGFRRAEGDILITMDADLQDDPAEIPLLIQKLNEGWDLVSGWKQVRHDPWHKTLPSKVFNYFTVRASGLKLHDFNCGLKAYRREVAQSLNLYGELHRYIPVLAHWNGFRVTEKSVNHRARKFGHSKYGLARLNNGLFDLITLLFLHRYTSRPLHLFGFVGLLFSMLGSLVLTFFLVEWMVTGNLHMRPLMLAGVASMIVGIQFVSIGLLGEMINHRFTDSNPPIRETIG